MCSALDRLAAVMNSNLVQFKTRSIEDRLADELGRVPELVLTLRPVAALALLLHLQAIVNTARPGAMTEMIREITDQVEAGLAGKGSTIDAVITDGWGAITEGWGRFQ